MFATPRDAASVILLRRGPDRGFQVFLLRRHAKSGFMASAFVFPGGAAEPADNGDLRVTAARELFEEAGVALTRRDVTPSIGELRANADAHAALAAAGTAFAPEALHPWSHWITPSIETKRFSARFYVAELPPGQTPSFDASETVDQVWVTAAEALVRARELALPPPQIRTFWELSRMATVDDVLAESRARGVPPPIMPRMAPAPHGFWLLLPWDPDYTTTGTGDAAPMAERPHWATGRSRFVLENKTWLHVAPPGTTAV
jgi:8-oxo-dGTP pyrophosphatase MutT (NUDIX family)